MTVLIVYDGLGFTVTALLESHRLLLLQLYQNQPVLPTSNDTGYDPAALWGHYHEAVSSYSASLRCAGPNEPPSGSVTGSSFMSKVH